MSGKCREKDRSSSLPREITENNGAMLHWKMRNISHGRMHAVSDMLSKYGLHYTHPRILGTIDHNDGATQKELAYEMNTSPAAMSATVRRLCKAGLIEKLPYEEDSRSNQIKLTDKGREVLGDTFGKTLEMDRKMLDGFTDAETEQLFSYLDRIQSNIDKMRGSE